MKYVTDVETDKVWVMDVEGDLIPSTVIYCLVAVNLKTKEQVVLTDKKAGADWIAQRIAEDCSFIFHNGLGYDYPTLNRLWGTSLTVGCIIDTMILSMLYNPSLPGGHSLKAWGERLKFPKIEFSDFTQLSDEMITYCIQDVLLTRLVYITLSRRMRSHGFSERGIELEHYAWDLIREQKEHGFSFNRDGAQKLYDQLRSRQADLEERAHEYWPPVYGPVRVYAGPFKKDGTKTKQLERHLELFPEIQIDAEAGNYTAFDYTYFDLASPKQRVEKLLELGWIPREFTDAGNPQPTNKGRLNPSLEEFVQESGNTQVRLLVEWMEAYNRANMINTWIQAYNPDTGCIHGSLWLANTLRYKHSEPNTANIPAVKIGKDDEGKEHALLEEAGGWTYESRALWTCRPVGDRVLVGVDAKGIQLRVLAHYLNNKDFTNELLNGDPHSYNQEIGGFRTRAIAKTFIYAFLLGAGDAKVGEIIGGSTEDGRATKERFVSGFPGLGDLLANLESQVARTGRIRLCDDTPVLVPQMHARLGYLLQGDESRIMKQAMIYTHQSIINRDLDVFKVGDIHDEHQYDSLRKDSEQFAFDVCPTAFIEAGKSFNYRLPIECDAKIGYTWAQTH